MPTQRHPPKNTHDRLRRSHMGVTPRVQQTRVLEATLSIAKHMLRPRAVDPASFIDPWYDFIDLCCLSNGLTAVFCWRPKPQHGSLSTSLNSDDETNPSGWSNSTRILGDMTTPRLRHRAHGGTTCLSRCFGVGFTWGNLSTHCQSQVEMKSILRK